MSRFEFHKDRFVYHSNGLKSPITRFKRKTRFKSINAMFRWFKVRKLPYPDEIYISQGRYDFQLTLQEDIPFFGLKDD